MGVGGWGLGLGWEWGGGGGGGGRGTAALMDAVSSQLAEGCWECGACTGGQMAVAPWAV